MITGANSGIGLETAKALTAHPGYAATNLQSRSDSKLMEFAMGKLGNRLLAQDAAGGALPILYAATQHLPGNTFLGPKNGMRGTPGPWCPFGGRKRRTDGPPSVAGQRDSRRR